MNFELFGYQEDAAADIISAMEEGYGRFAKNGKLTAVSLAAPTGAGKTVIATSVIEQLLFGSDAIAPHPEMTVLWVTDDPSLNEQTKRKMLQASSLIQAGQLVTVDASLDQKTLSRGKVYFINIQKLGKTTSYVTTGNKRQYSLWDIIGNTITARGDDFVLIIDEAHKGTVTKTGGKSITARLMDGTDGALPATPVVVGISATPERFVDAITRGGQRILEPVSVDSEAVRLSGLIKDKISIRHPKEAQPGDSTLLSLAVASLKSYDAQWAKYAKEQNEPAVTPALVIQVKAKTTDAELRVILDALAEEWSILDDKAIGHSFQEHSALNLGTRSVRYIAPQDIQDDQYLRVVLFKEALATGWDCPRAEVMFSFRTAQDYTYIAQLIGRMVRTPLARRVSTDGFLNTVALYLPHYDDAQVSEVVKSLEKDESGFTSAVEVDSVTCPRNPTVPASVWDCFSSIPSFTRPAKYHRNDVARLNALATLLVGSDIDPTAMETARTHIVDTLAREATRLGAALDKTAKDLGDLTYQTQTVDLTTRTIEKEIAHVSVNSRNIEDLFRQAKRALGDSAAKWYWNVLCDEENADADQAKIRVAALAQDPSVAIALEAAANTLVSTWREQHNGAILDLNDAKQERFNNIWKQSKDPEKITLILPTQVTAATKIVKRKDEQEVVTVVPLFKKHIFSNGKHEFPATFTGWEADVLAVELNKPTLVGWYRNRTGGDAALAVPYKMSGAPRTMYPDFIFFHEIDGDIVMDIVDPHRPSESDTGPKWTGLAKYAKDNAAIFRRVVAVIRNPDEKLLSLSLKNPDVATRLAGATNETDIRAIFDSFGGSY